MDKINLIEKWGLDKPSISFDDLTKEEKEDYLFRMSLEPMTTGENNGKLR
jgi:hypothetical protein|tara:strand:- start:33602 stop:33751 length:150 start_codon:yes stop_codon:yes gene_type:complete